MDVIGIDLSLTSTGIAIPEGQFVIRSKKKGEERLIDISNAVMDYVTSYPDPYVVIEGYSFASRSGQAFSIGELGGVVKTRLYKANVPFSLVPPTVRAKFATGKGNASKMEVVMAVAAKIGRAFEGQGADDMVDAWILREMGLYATTQQGQYEWPQKNLEALAKVEWA